MSMNILNRLFKRTVKPKHRMLYAITNGTYIGNCIVFINPQEYPKNGIYAAISFGGKDTDGGMEPMDIPEVDVINAIKNGILDKIQKIPIELYELCCAEYKERIKRTQEKTAEEK